MKRKAPGDDVTAPTPAPESLIETATKFSEIPLDARLQRALADLQYAHPTLVQAKAIPLALEGRDILARAKTGSGKTAAYLLPILQGLLMDETQRALVLVPTKELADQVARMAEKLKKYCDKSVKIVNIAQNVSEMVQRTLLADNPHIIVSTPSRAITHIKLSSPALTTGISRLVIDEADLLLSYGYEEDLSGISKALPRGIQTFLMSATLTAEVHSLKTLFCRSPAILKLEEDEAKEEGEGVQQFIVKCAEDEKFLLTYVIFKLKLIKGKVIIFVADIDRCYRLKLFLEQFGIRSCVLNAELPLNSRLHIVEEFNKGVYDIIIATDEAEVSAKSRDDGDEEEEAEIPAIEAPAATGDGEADADVAPAEPVKEKKKKRRKAKLDTESSTSRGLDFQSVSCVLNFDLPPSSRSYTHRIGRTARGAVRSGLALSFIVPAALHGKHKPTTIPSTATDEKVLARITKSQDKRGQQLQPYVFDMNQVNGFRYRMEDALRSVTRTKVREARVEEVKRELVNSKKLKRFWEENPDDLRHLRHDGVSGRKGGVGEHLKRVPEYLVPKGAGGMAQVNIDAVGVGKTKQSVNRIRRAHKMNVRKGRKDGAGKGAKRDPLKAFSKARK